MNNTRNILRVFQPHDDCIDRYDVYVRLLGEDGSMVVVIAFRVLNAHTNCCARLHYYSFIISSLNVCIICYARLKRDFSSFHDT